MARGLQGIDRTSHVELLYAVEVASIYEDIGYGKPNRPRLSQRSGMTTPGYYFLNIMVVKPDSQRKGIVKALARKRTNEPMKKGRDVTWSQVEVCQTWQSKRRWGFIS